jgi:hypothetical protein
LARRLALTALGRAGRAASLLSWSVRDGLPCFQAEAAGRRSSRVPLRGGLGA